MRASVAVNGATGSTFTLRLAAVMLAHFHMGNRSGSAMTDDNSKEAAAAFITASLRNLIRLAETHKDLELDDPHWQKTPTELNSIY